MLRQSRQNDRATLKCNELWRACMQVLSMIIDSNSTDGYSCATVRQHSKNNPSDSFLQHTHKEKYSQTMIMKQISKLLRSQLQIKVLTFKWQGDLSWRQISFCHPIISAKNYCTWKYAMETWPTFFNIKESVYWQLMRPACVNNLLPASVNTTVHWIRNYDYTLRVIIEPTILTYQQ